MLKKSGTPGMTVSLGHRMVVLLAPTPRALILFPGNLKSLLALHRFPKTNPTLQGSRGTVVLHLVQRSGLVLFASVLLPALPNATECDIKNPKHEALDFLYRKVRFYACIFQNPPWWLLLCGQD